MSKKETAIATISKNQAISYIDNIKQEIMQAAENDARMNFSVGKMLSALSKGNAHILNGNKSFKDFIETMFSSTGKTFSTMRQWMVAFDHLNGIVPESEMLAWKPSNVGKIPAKLDAAFRKAVTNGEITAATKQDDIDAWVKAQGTSSTPRTVTTYARWDVSADKPISNELLTLDEIKARKGTDGVIAVHVDRFKPDNKPEYLLVLLVYDTAEYEEERYRAYSPESQKRDKEAAAKQAAKEAALAELAESLHLSNDDLAKFLAIAKTI